MKPVKVMDMALPAVLLSVVKVSVKTPPLIVGVENTALALLATGLPPKADEPDIVITSLPPSGTTATGVMLMVSVNPATLARTSVRANEGPVKPPLTISGKDPVAETPRRRFDESVTAAAMALFAA